MKQEIGLPDLYCLPYGNLAEKIFPDMFNDPAKPNVARYVLMQL